MGMTPRTHCPRGHKYVTGNIYVSPKTGRKSCLACRRNRNHELNTQRKAGRLFLMGEQRSANDAAEARRRGWWEGAAAFRDHAEEFGVNDACREFDALLAADEQEVAT